VAQALESPGSAIRIREAHPFIGRRAGARVEASAALRTVVKGSTMTAGNSSEQNDAAAICTSTSAAKKSLA